MERAERARPQPPQDRVRRDQRRHFTQDPSPEAVASRREPAPLGIGQPHMPPCERLVEDAGLFTRVRDHVELVEFTQPERAMRQICS